MVLFLVVLHFCNLSSVHARQEDTVETLEEKVFFATLIGDIQSLATDFLFLSEGTKRFAIEIDYLV
jgi:hypothetical protein